VATVHNGEHGEEWRLGIELGDDHEHSFAEHPGEPPHNLSLERLERPLQVVTVEHLGWAAIAAYALLTRLAALGARPLGSAEASHALYELGLVGGGAHEAAGYHPAYSGWVHLLSAGFFEIGGANDFTARIVYAFAGLLMVAMAFELRHYVGRAGGLALGAMLALSPSAIFFSRASATAMPAAALALVTIAAFMALRFRPSVGRAAALGLFSGLMIAADPIGLVTTAIFIAALIPIGLWELVTGKNVFLATRVWLDRYSTHVVVVIVTAAAVWLASELAVLGGLKFAGIGRSLRGLFSGTGQPGFIAGLRFYLPAMAMYEFMIAIAAVIGMIAIIGLRTRSRFAAWCLIWAVLSIGAFLWIPSRNAASILPMLVAAAVAGAIGIDWLHHTDAWRMVRLPLAAIAAITMYIGAIGNFVYFAPDASEAPWARHANLYWGDAATTEQARLYSRQAAAGIPPASATVFFDGQVAAPLRWYLRDLRPLAAADAATVIVSKSDKPLTEAQVAAIYHFDYEEGWLPNLAAADYSDVMHFLLSGRLWGQVTARQITIVVRKPATSAPTVILTPGQ
jgi:predicted membrane-bound mannosyltransferase